MMLTQAVLAAWIAAMAADATTTHLAVAHGGHEQLLGSQQPYVLDGVMATQAIVGWLVLDRLHHTRPKLARTLQWTIIGIHAGAAVYNLHTYRGLP